MLRVESRRKVDASSPEIASRGNTKTGFDSQFIGLRIIGLHELTSDEIHQEIQGIFWLIVWCLQVSHIKLKPHHVSSIVNNHMSQVACILIDVLVL